MKFLALLPFFLGLALANPIPEAAPAPVSEPNANQGTSNKVIVMLKKGAILSQNQNSLFSTKLKLELGDLKAYSGEFSAAELDSLKASKVVEHVEPDAVVSAAAITTSPGAVWNLGAISHVSTYSSGVTPWNTYVFDNKACSGLTAYIIDTGILTTHSEFSCGVGCSRALWGTNTIDTFNADLNGHGTHVAGSVGGNSYGVYKEARLVAVKVLNAAGSGTISSVINGIIWSFNHANSNGNIPKSVINMSLGGGFSAAMNSYVDEVFRRGLMVVAAAGNSVVPVSTFSPASAAGAYAVAAHDQYDCRASFSNYGPEIKLFAPGVSIRSAYIGSNTATALLSGTSMAAPHVAGLALYFKCQDPTLYITPAQTLAKLLSCAHPTVCARYPGDPNELAYNCSGA